MVLRLPTITTIAPTITTQPTPVPAPSMPVMSPPILVAAQPPPTASPIIPINEVKPFTAAAITAITPQVKMAPIASAPKTYDFSVYKPISAISDKVSAIIAPVSKLKIPVFSTISKAVISPSFNLSKFATIIKDLPLTNKFEALEEIGIQKTIPEIIMMSRFKPLFADNVTARLSKGDSGTDINGLNNYGTYFDIQIQLRTLMFENIVNFIRDIKSHPEMAHEFESQKSGYKYYIERVEKDVEFLHQMILKLENLKDRMVINEKQIYFGSAALSAIMPSEKVLTKGAGSFWYLEDMLTYKSVLSDFGFDEKLIENFTGTKMYLQTLYQVRMLLDGYSHKFLGSPPEGRNFDQDPINIKTSPKLESSIKFNSYATVNIPLARNNERNVNIQMAQTQLGGIVSSLPSTDSFKVAWASHLLAKEYRYSKALGNIKTQKLLSEAFEYNTKETNPDVFDNIIGNIGKSAVEVMRTPKLSLVGMGQIIDGDVVVLPFETRYIESANSTYTPGSAYFVDAIMANGEVDTTILQNYINALNTQLGKIGQVFEAFNVFTAQEKTESGVFGGLIESLTNDMIADPEKLLKYFETTINDANDSVGAAVFNLAKKNLSLKSALFTYLYLKAAEPAIDPTKLLILFDPDFKKSIPHNDSSYVSDIVNIISNSTVFNQKSGEDALSTMYAGFFTGNKEAMITNIEDLKNTLLGEKPNTMVSKIVTIFKFVLEQFKNDGAILNERTRFSGIRTQVMCAILFDALLSIIDYKTNWFLEARFDLYGASAFAIRKEKTNMYTVLLAAIDGVEHAYELIKAEKKILKRSLSTVLATLVSIRNLAQTTINSLNGSKKVVDDIAQILNKKELMPLLLNEAQIILLREQLDSIKANLFQDFNVDNASLASGQAGGLSLVTDDSIISGDLRRILFDYFSLPEYLSNNGHNTRILTVGIPWGLSKKLRDKISVGNISRKNKGARQNDIIRVNVFKVDMEFQDIVFKPISFTFELSRFVPRSGYVSPYQLGGTLDDVLKAITTKDYSVEIPVGNNLTLNNEEYSFLTDTQKKEILHNHIKSYMLELYVKLMTGISVSEEDFPVDEQNITNIKTDFVTKIFGKKLLDFQIVNSDISSTDLSKLGNITKPLMSTGEMFSVGIPSIATAHLPQFDHFIKTVATFKNLNSVYSDGLGAAQKLLTPKIFERVFNIAIDPDDFEINMTETLKKESGKESFESLLSQGRVVEFGKQESTNSYLTNLRYKLKDRSKKENNLIFEKYFVNIESIDEPPFDGKIPVQDFGVTSTSAKYLSVISTPKKPTIGGA